MMLTAFKDFKLGVELNWDKDPSFTGRLRVLFEEAGQTWSDHKGSLILQGAGLVLAGSLAHSFVQTAGVEQKAQDALAAPLVPAQITATVHGVTRTGTVQRGHIQMTDSNLSAANRLLRENEQAECLTAEMKVTQGAWKLPLNQHLPFVSSSVPVTHFNRPGFDNSQYACVADKPAP